MPESIRVREAARLTGVHPNTLLNWIRSGQLEAFKVGEKGHYRIRRDALDKFLKEHSTLAEAH